MSTLQRSIWLEPLLCATPQVFSSIVAINFPSQITLLFNKYVVHLSSCFRFLRLPTFLDIGERKTFKRELSTKSGLSAFVLRHKNKKKERKRNHHPLLFWCVLVPHTKPTLTTEKFGSCSACLTLNLYSKLGSREREQLRL